MAAKGISGLGVGMMAAGGLLAYSGINNAGILESLRALAKGEAPPKHPKEPFTPFEIGEAVGSAVGDIGATLAMGSLIAQKAMQHRGKHPYQWGGGHGSFCTRSMDCSGFVSCVLKEVGAPITRPLTTGGFLTWGGAQTVPWEQRGSGDLIIWPQHMGIAISQTQMIHTGGAKGCPCVVGYSRMRSGRAGVARRVKPRG